LLLNGGKLQKKSTNQWEKGHQCTGCEKLAASSYLLFFRLGAYIETTK